MSRADRHPTEACEQHHSLFAKPHLVTSFTPSHSYSSGSAGEVEDVLLLSLLTVADVASDFGAPLVEEAAVAVVDSADVWAC